VPAGASAGVLFRLAEKPFMAEFEQPTIVEMTLPLKQGTSRIIRGIKLQGTPMLVDADSGSIYSPHRRGGRIFHEIKDGLFAAIRSKDHILQRYGVTPEGGGELESVEELEKRVTEINMALDRVRGDVPPETRAELEALATDLSRAINGFKAEAREQVSKAAPGIDSLGRKNIGASCARLVAARNRLLSRSEEIGRIHPLVAVHKLALLCERDRIKAVAAHALGGVKAVLSSVAFKPGGDTQAQCANTAKRIMQLRQAVSTVYVNPFLPLFSETGEHLDEAARLLADGNAEEAKWRLVSAASCMARVSRRLR